MLDYLLHVPGAAHELLIGPTAAYETVHAANDRGERFVSRTPM